MSHVRHFLIAIAVAWTATATAQTTPPRAATAPAPAPAPAAANADPLAGYVLGPDDVVEVDVLGQPEFKTRARVRADGTIALPFIGDVKASEQTAISFATNVGNQLRAGQYYSKPIVNVEIVSFASRYITILGEVAQPGLQPVDRAYRVSEVIARAGGLREGGADYVLLRHEGGEEIRLPFEKLAIGTDADDPLVRPGDKLFVPAAQLYYIYGQINAPGAYPIKGDMSYRKAIARGGGMTASGSEKRLKVFRNGEVVKIRLEDPVQPGDVVVIGERLF